MPAQVAVIAERVEADAPLGARQAADFEFIQVNGPTLDDVQRNAGIEAYEAQGQLFDVVPALAAPSGVHVGFLVDLAADPLDGGGVEQVEETGDVIESHVEQGAAAGYLFLHEARRSVPINERPSLPAVAGGTAW